MSRAGSSFCAGTVRLADSTTIPLEAYISDDTKVYLLADGSTNTLQTIEYEHHKIHASNHYQIEDVYDLSINNVYDIQWTTPNTTKWCHFTFILSCESETEWYMYEGVSISTAGTSITPVNNNRNSSNVTTQTVKYIVNTSVINANADTAIDGATIIGHGIIGAGKDSGRARELILKQNTNYCFRAIANAAGFINFRFEYYEHTNKN